MENRIGTELESNIVYSLIDWPNLVQTNFVDPKWFTSSKLSGLVKFIVSQNGDFKNFIDLRMRVTQSDPNLLSDDDWDILANSQSLKADFIGYLSQLKKIYLQRQIKVAAKTVEYDVSDQNINDLKNKIKKLETDDEKKPEKTMVDLNQQTLRKLYETVPAGIESFKNMDRAFIHGIHGGQLVVIGARPAVGKTTFSINLAIKALIKNPGMRIDYFSLEMADEEVKNKIDSLMSGVENNKFVNPNEDMTDKEKEKVINSMGVLEKFDLQIYDQYETVEEISKIIKENSDSKPKGSYMAIVDYLQLVETQQRSMIRDKRLMVEKVSRDLKRLTTSCKIPIILLSQLSRAADERDQGRPLLKDLRETGAIEQDANVVGFLYVDKNAEATHEVLNFEIEKNREGRLAKLQFLFIKSVQRVVERVENE